MALETWADNLIPVIEREILRESGDDADTGIDAQAEWLRLANEFVAVYLADVKLLEQTLTFTDSDLTDGVIRLPRSIVDLKGVYIEGQPMHMTSRAAMDTEYPGWEEVGPARYPGWCFVEGRQLYCYPAPADASAVTVQAQVQIPLFTAETPEHDADNPIYYIPQGFEYVPAYYVLASLPADAEHARQAARVQRNAARVESMLPKMIDRMTGATLADFTF